jgi:Rieske Fe-S protein
MTSATSMEAGMDATGTALNPLTSPVQRRTVLAAAAATGLLAACSSGSGGDAVPSSPASPTGGTTADPAGTVVAAVAEVPVGGGFVNSQEKVVVTQPAAGQYKAFSAVCPHQGCLVSRVADNVIQCACHGSEFSAESGDVERGPADSGLAELAVAVDGGNIVRS